MNTSSSSNPASPSLLKHEIRLDLIFGILLRHKRKYILPLLLTGVITAALSLCVPRYYNSNVMLAPEYNNPAANMGGLSSVASSFGVNLGNMTSQDALSPNFYPDLMESTVFLTPLAYIEVGTQDGSFKGTYLEYLTTKQDFPFWTLALEKFKLLFTEPLPPLSKNKAHRIDPIRPSKSEDLLLQAVAASISCVVDKKTDVISITTQAQDPLVAAQLADTVKAHLQDFITNYRTQKARTDLQHIEKLQHKAYATYLAAQKKYAHFVDRHIDLTQPSFLTQQEQLENEMQAAYNNYNTLQQRRQLAEAKVLERTPAFTTIQNATVAVKHAGPKRMLITGGMIVLAFILTSFVLVLRYRPQSA